MTGQNMTTIFYIGESFQFALQQIADGSGNSRYGGYNHPLTYCLHFKFTAQKITDGSHGHYGENDSADGTLPCFLWRNCR